jgi:uncharacterized membrane protein YqjE
MSVRPSAAPPASRGLLDALRAIGGTLNEILHIRGALFAVELQEEIERRKQMLVLAALGLAFLHTALLLLTLFVVVVFWDTHRIAAIGAMATLYLACGGAALVRLRHEARASPAPFAATLSELQQDLAGLRAPG